MAKLTEAAARKVQKDMNERGRDDLFLRLGVQAGGCSGLRYVLGLDDHFDPDKDTEEEFFGVLLVVDKMSVPYLKDTTVDYDESVSLQGSGFTIDNPGAQGSCGCGSSFH